MSNSLERLDAVEIKVTIKPEQAKVAEKLLELKQDESEEREIYFCEDIQTFRTTKKLQLFEQGAARVEKLHSNIPTTGLLETVGYRLVNRSDFHFVISVRVRQQYPFFLRNV
jgi:hypothetical protein